MQQIEQQAQASASRLWQVVTDWAGHGKVVPLTTVAGEGPEGVGQRVVAVTSLGPLRLSDEMTVTLWQPPSGSTPGRVDLVKDGSVLAGTAQIEIVPLSESTSRLVWREQIRPRQQVLARASAPAFDLGTRVLFGAVVRRLVARAEADGR